MFVLKPTGTIYYSLGLAAEKPAGSSTDLLFFPAFLLHFFSTFRLKTKPSLSPLPSLLFLLLPLLFFISSLLQSRLQCVRERLQRRRSRKEDCLCLEDSPTDCGVKEEESAEEDEGTCHHAWTPTDHKLRQNKRGKTPGEDEEEVGLWTEEVRSDVS